MSTRWAAAARLPLPDGRLLTDSERIALSIVRHSRSQGINAEEIAAQSIEGRARWDQDARGRFGEAIASLKRFGLIDEAYDNADYRARPVQRGRGWIYRINDAGEAAMPHPFSYRCCDDAVHLFCVCAERTFCPEHGGGCHGSHD